MDDAILSIEDLSAEFPTPEGVVRAVNGVSLSLGRGETLVLTGESGSGKTSVGLSVMGLLPYPGRVTSGRVDFNGRDLLALEAEELRHVRGREVAMVFQDASTGLNPVLTVGQQVEETVTAHLHVSKREAKRRAVEVLEEIGLPDAANLAKRYPFQLSGGIAQRVMIAIAIAHNPEVLILDEPTSALDVTVQAAILDDLKKLQAEYGTSILLITHDLGVVAQMADDVAVMYAGRLAEHADVRTLFEYPRHPYTWALLGSRPRLDRAEQERLAAIPGAPPSLIDLPDECAFLPRCPKAVSLCRTEPAPPLERVNGAHRAACYNLVYQEEPQTAAAD